MNIVQQSMEDQFEFSLATRGVAAQQHIRVGQQTNKNMNRIMNKLYEDRNWLANKWIGKSESYRDAAKTAAAYGHQELEKSLRNRMRFWSKSAAEHIKEIE